MFGQKNLISAYLIGAISLFTLQSYSFADETGWQLVWSDEFEGNTIDPAKWGYEVNCWGYRNNEKQCYTTHSKNAFVQNGLLNIVAYREDSVGPALGEDEAGYNPNNTVSRPYSSARLRTKDKGDWVYGRFEARLKMPAGQGTWPAFWLMPTDAVYGAWAGSGEVDIAEASNLGVKTTQSDGTLSEPKRYTLGAIHYGGERPYYAWTIYHYTMPNGATPYDDFHTYALEWEDGEFRWYVDDILFATKQAKDWHTTIVNNKGERVVAPGNAPFNERFHMILNLAVGGYFPEQGDNKGIDESVFPQSLKVDYVRVYQCSKDFKNGHGCTGKPTYVPGETGSDPNNGGGTSDDGNGSDNSGSNGDETDSGSNDNGNSDGSDSGSNNGNDSSDGSDSGSNNGNDGNSDSNTDTPTSDFANANPLVLFDDDLNSALEFEIYNPDGAISYFESPVNGRGDVLYIKKTGKNGNLILNYSPRVNLSHWQNDGELVFDLNISERDDDAKLEVKLDSGWPKVSPFSVSLPELNTWTEVRIPLYEILQNKNPYSPDDSADIADILNLLVIEPTSTMTLQLDNIRYETMANSIELVTNEPVLSLFSDGLNEALSYEIYDPDKVLSFTEQTIENRGNVLRITKTGTNGNLFFNYKRRVDLTSWQVDGDLVFDLNILSQNTDSTLSIKLDSGWPKVSPYSVPLPSLNRWTEVRIPIADILKNQNPFAAGNYADISDIVNLLVIEPSGPMSFELDNIRFERPMEKMSLFTDSISPLLILDTYSANGSLDANIVDAADTHHGKVIQFDFKSNNALGYLYRKPDSDDLVEPMDLREYDYLEFDLFVQEDPRRSNVYIEKSQCNSVCGLLANTSLLGSKFFEGSFRFKLKLTEAIPDLKIRMDHSNAVDTVYSVVVPNLNTWTEYGPPMSMLLKEGTTTVRSTSDVSNILSRLVFDNADPAKVEFKDVRYIVDGTTFDLKTETITTTEQKFTIKIDCFHPCSSGDVPIETPPFRTWTHYRIPLDYLVNYENSTLNLYEVDAPFVILPSWGKQNGVTIQVDNVELIKSR